MTYLTDTDADDPLASLQAASCTYRIALGPRAGQKVLSLHTVASREGKKCRDTVRRGAWVQLACRGALRRGSTQATRTAVSVHHPPRARQ